MLRRTFFTETVAAPVLGRLHLATGYSVVALTGALTWQTIADTTPDTRGGWLQTLVWAGSLILLAFTATLVMWLGDPEQAISGTTDYAWHVVLPHLSRWLVIVSGGAVLLSCGLLASTRPRALALDLDRYATVPAARQHADDPAAVRRVRLAGPADRRLAVVDHTTAVPRIRAGTGRVGGGLDRPLRRRRLLRGVRPGRRQAGRARRPRPTWSTGSPMPGA